MQSPTDWQEYVDAGRGLSIWVSAGMDLRRSDNEGTDRPFLGVAGELANSDEIRELLEYASSVMQQGDMFVGAGFQYGADSSRDLVFLNNINAVAVPYEGLSLPLMAQACRRPVGQSSKDSRWRAPRWSPVCGPMARR